MSFVPQYNGEARFMDLARDIESQGFAFDRPIGWLEHPKNKELVQMDVLFVRNHH
jgi:hypothetical protein